MPDLDVLPNWLRTLGRLLRISSYGWLVFVAIGDLRYTPAEFLDRPLAVIAWSIPLGILALAAMVAVALRRWRWEWTLAFWLAGVVALRAATVWSTPGPPPPLAGGSLVTFAVTCLLLRGLDLTVFAVRTSAWKIRARRL